MNDNQPETEIPLSILEEAADWLDRQADLPAAEQSEFEGWLAASHLHARAYAAVRRAMLDTALLDAVQQVQATAAPRPARAAWGWAAAGLAAAAAIVIALFLRAPSPPPALQQEFATGLRERADWRLADNSHLFLNADSRVSVVYQQKTRALALTRGEAIFEVAKDPARPFRVTAQAVTVTAVGTSFGVDIMNNAVGVHVYHGVVTVAQAGAPTISLHKGDWLTLDPRSESQGGHFDPGVYQNWRTDWLEADNMPLPYVVAKLNRYTDTPIVIGDAALDKVTLTGRFRLSDTDAALRLIAALLDVSSLHRDHHIYLTAHRG